MQSVTPHALRRDFGHLRAVDDLDLDLPSGGVIALVGPNGSGKSTLIRMILGLIRPTSGEATVLGRSIHDPSQYAADVGALIESPAFVPALSARKNLLSLSRLRRLPDTRVDEVLETVGLTGRDEEAVKRFSLGMKQRLGIAAALLPDPQLLILDEPTNGLDPAGIVEIRGLLRQLADEGRTVVVSSHLLSELEAISDYIVVIRFGEVMFSGPMSALLAQTQAHIDLACEHPNDAPQLRSALSSQGWTVQNTPTGLRVKASAQAGAQLNRAAADAGITLNAISFAQDSLEDIFLAMTGDSDADLAQDRAQVVAR